MDPKNARVLVEPTHTCHGCGRSCEAQLVGPLPAPRVERLRALHAELAERYPRLAQNRPFMLGRTANGETLTFLHFPNQRCVFLADDAGCLLHRHYGADEKPAPCRTFPFIAIAVEDGLRLGRRPLCYRAHRDRSPAMRVEPMEVVADFLPDDVGLALASPSPRPALRVSQAPPEAIREALGQEHAIIQWLLADGMSVPECLHRLAGMEPQAPPRTTLPPAFLQHLATRLAGLAAALASRDADAHTQSTHGRAIGALLETCRTLPQRPQAHAPLPPLWRAYALEGLAQLVFLRETSRFPSVAIGALVLAFGPILATWHAARVGGPADADAAAAIPDAFGEALATWYRLLLQSNAFALLFPTPDALAALVGALETR